MSAPIISTGSFKVNSDLEQQVEIVKIDASVVIPVSQNDLSARTDIANSATSTFLKCDADGKLEIEATLELDSSSLAKEITLGNVFGKVALTADRTFAIMNRQLGTSGQEVQHAKCMGSKDGTTTGIQHQLAVDSAGHLQVDILSGGGSSDATAANQLISQGKLDSVISNTASLGDTANRTLLTAQNQTNGNQITNVKGNTAGDGTGTATSVLVDADGHLQVDILSGGGSSDATAANQLLSQGKLDTIIANTSRQPPAYNRTDVIPVQIMVGDAGANYDALRANGQDLMVMVDDMNPDVALNSGLSTALNQTNGNQITNVKGNTAGDGSGTATSVLVDTDGHLQVDILSGGGSSDATAGNQVVSQGKLDSIISNTSGGNNTANRTLLTAQNQTNGNQVSKCMGLFGATQVQLKVDTNGVLETSGGGGGGGGSTQYDSASTLPTPTVGTAVLGVDSGGLANVISTDDTGKVGSVIHGTNSSGVAYPVAINQFSRAITVDDAVNKTSYLTTQTATIPASTSYLYPTATSLGSARSFTIFGNTTNWTDPIYIYAAKNGYSGLKYKMWENPIQPDPSSGDFYINLPLTSTPYLYWGKANNTLVAETISVDIIYMD